MQDSEGRELELAAKTAGKHAEQAELAGRVAECQAKLETKLQDLRVVADAKQQVHTLYYAEPCESSEHCVTDCMQ